MISSVIFLYTCRSRRRHAIVNFDDAPGRCTPQRWPILEQSLTRHAPALRIVGVLAAETSRVQRGVCALDRGRHRMLLPAITPQIRTFDRSAVHHVMRDVLVVLVILTFAAGPCLALENRLPLAEVTLVAGLFAAMAGVAAALLAVLAVRLTDDRRFAWLGMALGCYSLLAIPTTTIGTLEIGANPATAAARFLVQCLIVAQLVVALLELRPPTGWQGMSILVGGAGAVAGACALATAFPRTTYSVTSHRPLQLVVALSATAVALVIAALAARRQAWALWYVALGFAVIGLADTGRASVTVSPDADLGLGFSTVRLSGVVLALWGTLCLIRQVLTRLDDELDTHEEELRLAEIRLTRTAERDHELRTGLAGLASATTLLGTDRPDAPLLGTIVASELSRLDDLLRAPVGVRSETSARTYAVAPVICGLAALRRSSGMDIRLDNIGHGLRAVGSPATLTQVITDLVANAARHAPKSPVWISATQRSGRVVIRVRDVGLGVPHGHERAVFEPGVRDHRLGGLGLGLGICRDLLSAEDGSIAICPTDPERPGCVVVVELPAGPPDARASQSLVASGVPSAS
jgi:two-component system OmpR family sensor kinase